MKSNQKTIINKPVIFYAASFLQNISYGIIGPLFVVYLLSIKFSPAQIGVIFTAERISSLLFEVPTGGFADQYGRKKSILISFLVVATVTLVWFFSQNFLVLLGAAILWGLAYAFQSGAEESLIIDCLKLTREDQKRNKVFSRVAMCGNFGFFIGGLVGASLAFYFLRSIWLIASLISVLVFALYFLFTQEKWLQPKFYNIESSLRNFFALLKRNLIFALKNKILFIFLIITLVWSLVFGFYSLGYPILLKKTLKIPTYWFGLLGSLSALVGVLGAYGGERSTRKFGPILSLASFSIIASGLFIFFGLTKAIVIALILFTTIELIKGGWYPIYQSFLNKFIPREKRATLLSLNSGVSTAALAVGELLAGFLLTFFYSGYALIIGGVFLFSVPFLFYKIKKESAKK